MLKLKQHMEFSKLSTLIVAQFICFVYGKVTIIPDTKLEDCSDQNNYAEYFDVSKIDLIPIDDEHVVMNGTWKFLKEVKSPWHTHLWTEKNTRGEWLVQALDRRYEDFCLFLHSATEPWSYAFDGKESCPIPAGTDWNFDMLPIKFSPVLLEAIPPHYAGRWRFNIVGEFDDGNGGTQSDCKRIYGDIFED